jgi:hypothetical protein
MSALMIVGALILLLGIAGLAVPYFTTHETKNVASVGDLKVQAREDTPHEVPPALAEGALVVGVLLLGAGFLRRA